jgi:hypothetical protein
MAFYSDIEEPAYWRTNEEAEFIPMSTAIVRIYTSQCFVVAADGRNRKTKGN